MKSCVVLIVLLNACLFTVAFAQTNIAYIHGDVSRNGVIPSSADPGSQAQDRLPFDQMLLTDTGVRGMSQFQALLESQGHSISQHYDQQTTLDANFFNGLDVVIFGLHQKLWTQSERNTLDAWIRAGGGMLIYSDSASGGQFSRISSIGGAQNNVGQTVTNNLIAPYGMNVTVDQADGVPNEVAIASPSQILIPGQTLRGEGVSPIEANDAAVEILIPYTRTIRHFDGLPADGSREFASLAIRAIGQGHVSAAFDRQPFWNQDSPGSDITRADNMEILRRLINFLAQRSTAPAPSPNPSPPREGRPIINGALFLLLDD